MNEREMKRGGQRERENDLLLIVLRVNGFDGMEIALFFVSFFL